MTQPQQQNNTRGQVLDESRSECRARAWPGVLTKWTLTLANFEVGLYSFKINGILIDYTATGGDDATTTIAALKAKFEATAAALRLAFPTAAAAVLTLVERSVGQGFSITDTVAPGAATLTAADVTPTKKRLGLGLGVALNGTEPDEVREMMTGDTAARLFGITVENSLLALNSGDDSDADGYDPGSPASILTKGIVPVPVEEDVTTTEAAVWLRINAPGTEETGAWRVTDAGGGNSVQITNAKWTGLSYLDNQGRRTAELYINLP